MKEIVEKVEKGRSAEIKMSPAEEHVDSNWTIQNGVELVVNLGDFQSLRLISYRRGVDPDLLREEIFNDLLSLRKSFLDKAQELYE